MDTRILSQLKEIVGEEYVSTRKDVLLTYSTSASMSYHGELPDAVIRPKITEEVSEIVKRDKITGKKRDGLRTYNRSISK